MIGARPCTDWLPPEIERDDKGPDLDIGNGHAAFADCSGTTFHWTSVAAAPAWQASKGERGNHLDW
jgi:hypothetical protein